MLEINLALLLVIAVGTILAFIEGRRIHQKIDEFNRTHDSKI